MPFVDFSYLKEPFFDIKVGPPNAKPSDMKLLPFEVSRLFKSFEYNEVRDGGQNSSSVVTLFAYDIDYPGSILDIKMSSEGEIIYVTPQTLSNTSQQNNASDTVISDDLKSDELKTIEAQRIKELDNQKKSIKTRFLFQENNTIEITWGYRNYGDIHELSPRTVRAKILQVTYKAGESEAPMLEIRATDFGSGEMSKIYPEEGLCFTRKKVKELISGKKNFLDTTDRKDTEHARIDDVFQAIAATRLPNADVNIRLTDSELKLDISHKLSNRTWPISMNLHTFLKRLAETVYAQYFITTAIIDGQYKTILNLISRKYYEEFYRFHFMWKSGIGNPNPEVQNNSFIFNTVKNYNMAIFPGGGDGASSKGVSSEAKQKVGNTTDVQIQFEAPLGVEQRVLSIPKPDAEKFVAKDPEIAKANKSVGVSKYSDSNDKNDHVTNSEPTANRLNNGLRLDFSTIGIPQLFPTVVKFSNIGIRYSGLYSILSVVHKIDSEDGYTCACSGQSGLVHGGGSTLGGQQGTKTKSKAEQFASLKFKSELDKISKDLSLNDLVDIKGE
jgi:hypothetical protein